MEDYMLSPFLSDLVAGLIGAAILGGLALLFHKVGPERGPRLASKLRHPGWPFLTFVFLGTALRSAILWEATGTPAVVFAAV